MPNTVNNEKLSQVNHSFTTTQMLSSTYKGVDVSLNLNISEKCKIAAQIFFGIVLAPIGVGVFLIKNAYQNLRDRKIEQLELADEIVTSSEELEKIAEKCKTHVTDLIKTQEQEETVQTVANLLAMENDSFEGLTKEQVAAAEPGEEYAAEVAQEYAQLINSTEREELRELGVDIDAEMDFEGEITHGMYLDSGEKD